MSQSIKSTERYRQAASLLRELNCPKQIMEALELWGWFVAEDEVKLNNWLATGGVIEGEARELSDEELETQGIIKREGNQIE